MSEQRTREDIVRLSKSLFDRGFSVGSAGNISVAIEGGFLITPTNSSLGAIDPACIAKVDNTWRHVEGDKPSKEIFLHRAFYESRPATGAVVHLHSTYATVLSCMTDIDDADCIPPLTPYVVMRVGRVRRVPYVTPGDVASGDLIRDLHGKYAAILLANHGPIVAGKDLFSAVYAAEELEETAKLALLLRGVRTNILTEADRKALEQHRLVTKSSLLESREIKNG